MSRKSNDVSTFPSLTVEGNLISSAMISSIYALEADEQDPAAYQLREGLSLRDEFSLSFRVARAHFDKFAMLDNPNRAATVQFIEGFLREAFGFDDLSKSPAPLALMAGQDRVPVVVVPPSDELDKASESISGDRRRSATFALQDYLNERDEALWGLATNGVSIRLMRDNASLTRPAHIEANLAQIFETEDIASFATLWLLIHRSRFGNAGTPATDCSLERWKDTGEKEGTAARDRLAEQVEDALRMLGSGFLGANPELRARLASGDLKLTEWFNELLKFVYRLIFLMVAEDRNLLHAVSAKADVREAYAQGYSLAHLRRMAIRRTAWDRHHDKFEGVKIVFSALGRGEPRLGLPALGGLFSEGQMPDLREAKLSNRALMGAIFKLGWLRQDGALVPINWRAMETEELGSVYESLLELQPQLSENGRELKFASEAAEKKGNQRKTTGSYYTPDSLVQALLDTALDPVLDRTEAEADDPAKALLELSVIDPACGSGHFLLAAARRIATRVARHRSEGTPSAAEFRHALRDVARSCLYGVDRNPMAVELTKVALWIETVDPGMPLGFFDAQIRCGDALLGVYDLKVLQDGIPDAAYKPRTGDDKGTAKYYLKANRDARAGQGGFDFGAGQASMPAVKPLALDFSGFRDLPEDTVEQIGTKAKRFKDLRKGQTFVRAKAAADLYVAAFLLPKVGGAPAGASARTVPTTEELWMALNQGKMRQAMVEAPKAARNARALHWPLEFPDVMQRGGFDVVLGNPPWERIKLQEQEFFASRSPEIANAPNKAARDRLIKGLEKTTPGTADRALFDAFNEAKREAESTSEFVRVPGEDGGRFALTGRGDVNTYALFAELFANLARRRAGVIVPTGIATDATTAPFFGHLVETRRLAQLVDFENRSGLFPAIDSRMKFVLLTLGREEAAAHFAFFLTEPAQLAQAERNFTLSPTQIAAINPNTKTAPVFRSRSDAELTAKIFQNAPVLVEDGQGDAGNLWGINIARHFDMNKTDVLAVCEEEEFDGAVRILEAKMIHQFDHRFATYVDGRSSIRDANPTEKASIEFETVPRYFTAPSEARTRLERRGWQKEWIPVWRDICRTTDERTMICCLIPFCATDFTIRAGSLTVTDPIVGFVANANSLTLDFVVRNKMGGTHLSDYITKQIPFLPPNFYTEPRLAFITPKVLELSYTSHSLAPFARDLGHDGPPFVWDEDRRAYLRADLDAFYARAYGLTRDELRYILDPADVKGPDYPSETFRVLKEKEIRQHGEFRTRRLVLEAWDRMEADGTFTQLGLDQ